MAKAKNKGAKGGGSKHLQARVAYLKKASFYLASQRTNVLKEDAMQQPAAKDLTQISREDRNTNARQSSTDAAMNNVTDDPTKSSEQDLEGKEIPSQSLRLVNHLRAVALKSQIRLDLETKRSICKVCDTPLMEGISSVRYLENLSKGRKKPWASVLTVNCLTCGCPKRFPTGAKRQSKKTERHKQGVKSTRENSCPFKG